MSGMKSCISLLIGKAGMPVEKWHDMWCQGMCSVSLSGDAIWPSWTYALEDHRSHQPVQWQGFPNHHPPKGQVPSHSHNHSDTGLFAITWMQPFSGAIKNLLSSQKGKPLCCAFCKFMFACAHCSHCWWCSLTRNLQWRPNVANLSRTVLLLQHLPVVPMVLQAVSVAGIHGSWRCWEAVNLSWPGVVTLGLFFLG